MEYGTYNKSANYDRYEVIEDAFPAIMRKVFTWMTLALGITGLTAYGVASSPNLLYAIYSNQILFWGLMLGELGLVIALSAAINRISASTATLLFILYSVLNGVTMAFIFIAYTMSSIATTFFVTAGTFGAMALYGYSTKSDLTSWGKYFMMALIGLIIASVVNIFLGNSTLEWICSCIGVVIFTGLTAYDTQKIKAMAMMSDDSTSELSQKLGVIGALTLYLDFINLFLYLLRFLGRRND